MNPTMTKAAEIELRDDDHAYIWLQPEHKEAKIDYQAHLTHDAIAIRVDYDRAGKLIGIDIIGFR